MPQYWNNWAKKDAESVFSAASASSRAPRTESPVLAAGPSPLNVPSTPTAPSQKPSNTTPPSFEINHASSSNDMATTFHKFVDLAAELQIRIIEFAWASIERKVVNHDAHPCEFELGRLGLFCPSVPSFNAFRRSFKSKKLLPLAQQAIFLKSSLLVHVHFARESFNYLPVGYIPTVLLALDKEPILRQHIHRLVIDISCFQGQGPRATALRQSFESRFREDDRGGPNYMNALRRQNELGTFVSEITNTFPNRNHLYIKLKADFMSAMDLVMIFGLFHAPDRKITLEEFCTIQGGHDEWPSIEAVVAHYEPIAKEAAIQAGHDWLVRHLPTYSVPWKLFADSRNYGQMMYQRTSMWQKRR